MVKFEYTAQIIANQSETSSEGLSNSITLDNIRGAVNPIEFLIKSIFLMIRRVTYPKTSVSWLGLTEIALKKELRRRFTRTVNYQERTISSKYIDDTVADFDGDVSRLTEGELYPCCIEAEMTINELRDDEPKLTRIYSKWSKLLGEERGRLERFLTRLTPAMLS